MTWRMYDAAYPPANPPNVDAVAFYIGGDTPHPWTAAEIARQRARYRLPIYVRSNPSSHNAHADAAAAIAWLRAHHAPHGCAVALDLETAIDGSFVRTFDADLLAAGYVTLAYGSLSTIFHNPKPSGGYWVAHYTGSAHMEPGSVATQWASDVMLGHPWDLSEVSTSVPLWDTHATPPVPTPTPAPDEEIDMAQRDLRDGLDKRSGLILPPKTGGYTYVEAFGDGSLDDGKQVKPWAPVDLRVVIEKSDGTWQRQEPFTVGRGPKDTKQPRFRIKLDDKNSVAVSVTRLTGTGTEEITVAAY